MPKLLYEENYEVRNNVILINFNHTDSVAGISVYLILAETIS